MILAVLSTVPRPFPRAVRLARELQDIVGDPDLRIQYGHTPPMPSVDANWRQWYSRTELAEAIRECTTLLVHGGSGCIFEALRNGARPIAVPRLARFGEHFDDHQVQLCSRLDAAGVLVNWCDGDTARDVRNRLACLPDGHLGDRPDLRPVVWSAAHALAENRR